jgi:hypothetical protein
MSTCARPGCLAEGMNRGSVYLRESYCCGVCQRGDYTILKKLSFKFQPYHEMDQIILEILGEISKRKKQQGIRVLTHLISYAKSIW